jgi:3-methylfumaryl-CoA hydratase
MADFASWIGRSRAETETLDARLVRWLAATLERPDGSDARVGQALPAGWHWTLFAPVAAQSSLGRDGHPSRTGDFLPPTSQPRRMWAGGRLVFHAPVPVGTELRRESEITGVEPKSGRSGRMVFVVVRHRILAGGVLAIEEEHDIVYREAPAPGSAPPVAAPPPPCATAPWRRRIEPDAVLLFRYSALTANGHRIHYDHPYVTGVEGYPGLVFHGPLTATLLMALAETGFGRPLTRFEFRNKAPLFADAPFEIAGMPDAGGDAATLWAATPAGGLATEASAAA